MRTHFCVGRYVAVAAAVIVLLPAARAEDDRSMTRKLIDADAKLALQKLEADLNKNVPTQNVSAAPAGVGVRSGGSEGGPHTIALYGVDGSAAGLPSNLRAYVKWGEQVYPARVGAKWRGYTVASINEDGTVLKRGKHVVLAPLDKDDAAVFERPSARAGDAAGGARPAGPMPGGAGVGQPGGTFGQGSPGLLGANSPQTAAPFPAPMQAPMPAPMQAPVTPATPVAQ